MPMMNWSGTVAFANTALHGPRTVNELRAIVSASTSCRVVGSAHSFSRIVATTGALISLADLPTRIEIDAASSTVTVSSATLYGELAIGLHAAGFALHNLASLPHISVAGACATGTHGSGIGNGPLSSSVAAVELVTASGDLVRLAHGDQDFPGAVVSLGALGALTALTLRIEPTYEIAQHVFTGLPVHVAATQLCEILALGYSVSLFTSWGGDVVDQVWVKRRVDGGPIDVALLLEGGAQPSSRTMHPIARMPADACTVQQGVPGPWHERLPHFALAYMPSAGDEIQSEYFVASDHAADAMRAILAVRDVIRGPLLVSEIRAVAADDQWLSMSHERASVAFHFTWISDVRLVMPAIAAVEAAIAPFAPRPHWGKVFSIDPTVVRSRYRMWNAACEVMTRLDPNGTFRNDFIRQHFMA